MPEQPRDIDTSVLDTLIGLRHEATRLAEFLQKAEDLRANVEEAVFRRVVDDYTRRQTALEQKAAPLKTKARHEFQKLLALYSDLNQRNDAARLRKQELEFRHAVGELTADELTERLREPEDIIAACEQERASFDACKATFLEADADLEREPPPPAAAPTILSEPAGRVPSHADFGDVTRLSEPAVTMTDLNARGETGAAAPEDEGHTMLLPEAALVSIEADRPAEYPLAAMSYIGRSNENHVRIARPGVSRRHALIVASPSGYTIKDLKSQNGTFVNGESITECTLANGDVIWIGDAKLMFRLGSGEAVSDLAAASAARFAKRDS
jgi:hypothetical protein